MTASASDLAYDNRVAGDIHPLPLGLTDAQQGVDANTFAVADIGLTTE